MTRFGIWGRLREVENRKYIMFMSLSHYYYHHYCYGQCCTTTAENERQLKTSLEMDDGR